MKYNKIIEFMKWDSTFFGMKTGKARLDEDNFGKSEFIKERDKGQFDLIYGFSSAGHHVAGFWESLGFNFADCSITLSMSFDPGRFKNSRYELRNKLSKEDTGACYKIAEDIARASRFYRERAIGERLTKKMYRRWIDTALDGSFCDGIFVSRIKGKVAGLSAVRTEKNTGICSLIGVKREFQGQGIGKKLLAQAFNYWALDAHGIDAVKVKFSAGNLSAFGFYVSMGFDKIAEVDYIYHYSKTR